GPSRVDTSWLSVDPDVFALKDFAIDWEKQEITCSMGKVSKHWKPSTIIRNKRQCKTIQVQFTRKTCVGCSYREKCTRSKLTGRGITLHPTQQAREYQQTDEFRDRYKKRTGVEVTISLAAYTFNLQRTRYRGLEKTHSYHVCTATAINLKWAAPWMVHPFHAQTRISHFADLVA
ncbi:MAG: transposase, partial [Chloroflexota bacterium]